MSKPEHPAPDTGSAAVRLAAEVEVLRRQVEELVPLARRVDELSDVVAHVSQTLAAVAARRRPAPAPSWLAAPAEQDTARGLLDELAVWLREIFLRYPDGATALPDCWLWHPDVVEELLWLMHAWLAAYQGADASVAAASDWHDRQRPGVVNRLRKAAGSCSPEAHQTRPGWSAPTGGPVLVPGLGAVEAITEWWAQHRNRMPPEPVAAQPPTGFGGVLG
ncbi:hypothetical protein DMP17_38540 [Pseudonocardia sp. TMWB2A]|uniref:hypothetical protein n=1 Tax=Pseudonocardia sp. TMWB2A TaxID=687430 RepID=UPI00307F1FC9